MKKIIFFAFMTIALLSCKKNDNPQSIQLTGSWVFRNEMAGVFPYPYPYPQFSWSTAAALFRFYNYDDSVTLKFDNVGVFSGYTPGHNIYLQNDSVIYIPAMTYSGTFTKLNDSILLIQPDTSSLLNYSYVITQNTPFPNGDTLGFNQVSNDSLTLIQSWVSDSALKVSSIGLKRIN